MLWLVQLKCDLLGTPDLDEICPSLVVCKCDTNIWVPHLWPWDSSFFTILPGSCLALLPWGGRLKGRGGCPYSTLTLLLRDRSIRYLIQAASLALFSLFCYLMEVFSLCGAMHTDSLSFSSLS